MPEALSVGDKVVFKEYKDLEDGEDQIFQQGTELTVVDIDTTEGVYFVKDGEGNTDQLFSDEFSLPDEEGKEEITEDEEEGEYEEEYEPLEWKDVSKGLSVQVVAQDTGEIVAEGEVSAKTAANITVNDEKFRKADIHVFEVYYEEEEETEGEGEEEEVDEAEETEGEEEEEVAEVSFDDISEGDSILVVDSEDQDVIEGEVTKKTKTQLTINGEKFKKSTFSFYAFFEDAGEEEQEQDEEGEEEDEEEEEAPAPASKRSGKAKAKSEPKASAPAKSQGKEKNAASVVVESDTESVRALLAESDALEAARDIVETIEESYFNLGGLLHHIYREELFIQAGYDGKEAFKHYLEEELGIHYRKAMDLIKIYTHFSSLGVDETRLTEIGWSKAKMLVSISTRDNFDDLVDYALAHTREELKDYITTNYVDAGDGSKEKTESTKAKKVTFKFQAFEDTANVLMELIDQVKADQGIDTEGEAMVYIFTEYAQLVANMDIPLEDTIKMMEKKYDVELAVVESDKETKPPVKDKAKSLAKSKAPAKGAKSKAKAPAKKSAKRGK